MPELTLESLAARVNALEKQLAELRAAAPAKKDWRSAVGMFTGNEFQQQIDAEGRAIREAEKDGDAEELPQ